MAHPKGHNPWNKGLTKNDPRVWKYTKAKIGKKRLDITGEKNYQWKGDKVSYSALHTWVVKKWGKPNKCELCYTKQTYRFEWSNISGNYKREKNDWRMLCVKCHRKIDDVIKKVWQIRKQNIKLRPCLICNKLISSFKWQLCNSHYKLEWQKAKQRLQKQISSSYTLSDQRLE